MITEIAAASGQLIQLIDDLLRQTQTRRLEAATAQASQDVQDFKDDLLARHLDSVNLRLGGLRNGILVHLTDSESEQLHGIVPNLDAFALLGLYARARAADLAAECGEIFREAKASQKD
jgi:hypothetical protein